jgi:hypothetical protein
MAAAKLKAREVQVCNKVTAESLDVEKTVEAATVDADKVVCRRLEVSEPISVALSAQTLSAQTLNVAERAVLGKSTDPTAAAITAGILVAWPWPNRELWTDPGMTILFGVTVAAGGSQSAHALRVRCEVQPNSTLVANTYQVVNFRPTDKMRAILGTSRTIVPSVSLEDTIQGKKVLFPMVKYTSDTFGPILQLRVGWEESAQPGWWTEVVISLQYVQVL